MLFAWIVYQRCSENSRRRSGAYGVLMEHLADALTGVARERVRIDKDPVRAGAGASRSVVTGCGRLYRARSRLYRNELLQVNMRLKALAEIYTMHSFAQL